MKKTFIGNWKQNMTLSEVEGWLAEFEHLLEGFSTDLAVVLAPPHPYLSVVSEFAKKYAWLFVAAQDISAFDDGTHTGEVGGNQLKDFAQYCIVGHSERGEELDVVLQKVDQTFASGLLPIICFVEPEKLTAVKRDNAVLLWEDPGNISHEGVFTPKPVEEIVQGVQKIKETYGVTEGLIYGGSINRQNAQELGKIGELDGGIAGGASLDPQHFFDLISAFS